MELNRPKQENLYKILIKQALNLQIAQKKEENKLI